MGKKIKFINSGTFGCIYYPDFNCNEGKIGKQLYISKIQKESGSLDNELEIMNIIQKNIPNYYLYLAPILKVCPVKLNKIPDSEYKKCDVLQKNNNKQHQYISTKIRYVGKNDIEEYILSLPSQFQAKKMNHIYYYTLHELNKLNNEHIIHFDVKQQNIMYDSINHVPILIDFGISFHIKNYVDAFYTSSFYLYWCIDIFVIANILYNLDTGREDLYGTVTKPELDQLRNKFLDNLSPIIHTYIPDFNKKFTEMYNNYFYKFVCKTWQYVLSDLKRPKTWDNYSLAISMLLINIKYPYQSLTDICTEIILSPPNLRPTCADTIKLLDSIYE